MNKYFIIIVALVVLISSCIGTNQYKGETIATSNNSIINGLLKRIDGYIDDMNCYNGNYHMPGLNKGVTNIRLSEDVKQLKLAAERIDNSETYFYIINHCAREIENGVCNYSLVISSLEDDYMYYNDEDIVRIMSAYPTKNSLVYRSNESRYEARVFWLIYNRLWQICDKDYVMDLDDAIYELYGSIHDINAEEGGRLWGEVMTKALILRLKDDFKNGRVVYKD